MYWPHITSKCSGCQRYQKNPTQIKNKHEGTQKSCGILGILWGSIKFLVDDIKFVGMPKYSKYSATFLGVFKTNLGTKLAPRPDNEALIRYNKQLVMVNCSLLLGSIYVSEIPWLFGVFGKARPAILLSISSPGLKIALYNIRL
jgi:hypothetical protein